MQIHMYKFMLKCTSFIQFEKINFLVHYMNWEGWIPHPQEFKQAKLVDCT